MAAFSPKSMVRPAAGAHAVARAPAHDAPQAGGSPPPEGLIVDKFSPPMQVSWMNRYMNVLALASQGPMSQEALLHHMFNIILVESGVDRRQGATFEEPLDPSVLREALPYIQISQREYRLAPGGCMQTTTYVARNGGALAAIEGGGKLAGAFLGYLSPMDPPRHGEPPPVIRGWTITWNATWHPWFGHSLNRRLGEQKFELYSERVPSDFDLNELAVRRSEIAGRFVAMGLVVTIGFTVEAIGGV